MMTCQRSLRRCLAWTTDHEEYSMSVETITEAIEAVTELRRAVLEDDCPDLSPVLGRVGDALADLICELGDAHAALASIVACYEDRLDARVGGAVAIALEALHGEVSDSSEAEAA